MENCITLAISALLAILALRVVLIPAKLIFRVGLHSIGGFACLWLVNTVSWFTGITLPLNAVTVLIAGFWGIPGIGLIALMQML